MNLGEVIWLGILQGVTEFLPISSSGHLTLLKSLWELQGASLALDVALHVGTLGAIVLYFFKDIRQLLWGAVGRLGPDASRTERKKIVYIVLATVPTALIGLYLKGTVERLNLSALAAGAGFIVTALFLAGGEWGFRRTPREWNAVPWWHAVLLGIVQGGAVMPGVSRSGVTIALALLLGWRWQEAGRFSFFMAVPAIVGALVLSVADMAAYGLGFLLVGFGVSFLVGCVALYVLMSFLSARCLWPFAVYCTILGSFALFWLRG